MEKVDKGCRIGIRISRETMERVQQLLPWGVREAVYEKLLVDLLTAVEKVRLSSKRENAVLCMDILSGELDLATVISLLKGKQDEPQRPA